MRVKAMMKARSEKQLGEAIQSYRLKAGLTQLELARLSGTGQKTISKIENGFPSTRIETIYSVLAALELETNIDVRNKDNVNKNVKDFL